MAGSWGSRLRSWYCPSVGQDLTYLDVLPFDDSLTLDERRARGPFQSAFGVGRSHSAADAVARARREAVVAEAVYAQVKEQAVYALLCDELSIRAIADQAGIPKSEVGRIARRFSGHGARPVSHATVGPVASGDEFRDGVREAWGHE